MNIVFKKLKTKYSDEKLLKYLFDEGFEEFSNSGSYVEHFLKLNNITITCHNKNITVQSNVNKTFYEIITNLSKFNCLELDEDNEKKLLEMRNKFQSFPKHNSLLCNNCDVKTNYLINIEINEDNEIISKFNNCQHIVNLNSPFYMINNRILPDLSVLQSRILSKLISLNYFKNFEIVIPSFLLDASDRLTEKNGIKGIQNEMNILQQYENEDLITIYPCRYEKDIIDADLLEIKEDNIILKLAHLTNSILFTQDRNLQAKSVIQKRPTIFYDPKYDKIINKLIKK